MLLDVILAASYTSHSTGGELLTLRPHESLSGAEPGVKYPIMLQHKGIQSQQQELMSLSQLHVNKVLITSSKELQ